MSTPKTRESYSHQKKQIVNKILKKSSFFCHSKWMGGERDTKMSKASLSKHRTNRRHHDTVDTDQRGFKPRGNLQQFKRDLIHWCDIQRLQQFKRDHELRDRAGLPPGFELTHDTQKRVRPSQNQKKDPPLITLWPLLLDPEKKRKKNRAWVRQFHTLLVHTKSSKSHFFCHSKWMCRCALKCQKRRWANTEPTEGIMTRSIRTGEESNLVKAFNNSSASSYTDATYNTTLFLSFVFCMYCSGGTSVDFWLSTFE